MRLNDLLYSPAGEVAEQLLHAEWTRPTPADLTAALINALNRIAYLEKRVADRDARAAGPPCPGAGERLQS